MQHYPDCSYFLLPTRRPDERRCDSVFLAKRRFTCQDGWLGEMLSADVLFQDLPIIPAVAHRFKESRFEPPKWVLAIQKIISQLSRLDDCSMGIAQPSAHTLIVHDF
jgi:hypothetical protein